MNELQPTPKDQGQKDRPPIIDLKNGQGVSEQEIQRWKDAAKRFRLLGDESIDTYTFPRPQRTKDFFKGERDGKLNPINNPLQLIRPATLLSVISFFHENGQTYKSPRYY